MITLKNVCFAYDEERPVLSGINLKIENGEFVAIVGENGAGKTTLIKMLNGLLRPTAGDVWIDNVNIRTEKTSSLAKKVAFLFQNPDRQICKNTVLEELLFSLACVGQTGMEAEQEARRVAEKFGLNADSRPYLLSRGERQRVALASVVAVRPQILVLDEPTTGLDYRECMGIMQTVSGLNADGTTVIMVCHDMELVADFARRVVVMDSGKIAADGPCKDVLADPQLESHSAVLPPQIFALSRRLGAGFEKAYTYLQMADEIEGRCTL